MYLPIQLVVNIEYNIVDIILAIVNHVCIYVWPLTGTHINGIILDEFNNVNIINNFLRSPLYENKRSDKIISLGLT